LYAGKYAPVAYRKEVAKVVAATKLRVHEKTG
jgi:hypothetical protein